MLKVTVPTDAAGNPRLHPDTKEIWPDVAFTDDHQHAEGEETCGVLDTGRHSFGIVTLADGTRYDVTPRYIEHAPGHAGPLCHHIEKQYEAMGATHADGSEFAHVCTEACGAERSAEA